MISERRLSQTSHWRAVACLPIEEAVASYRQLAQARPDAFLPDLAASLDNQSTRLAELGRAVEALTGIKEEVTIRRRLVVANPFAYEPNLVISLKNSYGRPGGGGAPRGG